LNEIYKLLLPKNKFHKKLNKELNDINQEEESQSEFLKESTSDFFSNNKKDDLTSKTKR
jgi:hypothetical protein